MFTYYDMPRMATLGFLWLGNDPQCCDERYSLVCFLYDCMWTCSPAGRFRLEVVKGVTPPSIVVGTMQILIVMTYAAKSLPVPLYFCLVGGEQPASSVRLYIEQRSPWVSCEPQILR